jgi:hypothetical protein
MFTAWVARGTKTPSSARRSSFSARRSAPYCNRHLSARGSQRVHSATAEALDSFRNRPVPFVGPRPIRTWPSGEIPPAGESLDPWKPVRREKSDARPCRESSMAPGRSEDRPREGSNEGSEGRRPDRDPESEPLESVRSGQPLHNFGREQQADRGEQPSSECPPGLPDDGSSDGGRRVNGGELCDRRHSRHRVAAVRRLRPPQWRPTSRSRD